MYVVVIYVVTTVCVRTASKLTKVAQVAWKLHSTAKVARSRENVKIAQKLYCVRLQFFWLD